MNACRICGNTNNNASWLARERMFNIPGEHAYVQCAACGLLQIAEYPQDISTFYPQASYYSFKKNHAPPSLRNAIKVAKDNFVLSVARCPKWLLEILNTDPLIYSLYGINLKQNSNILDVGCGSGAFIDRLITLGFKNSTGLDPYSPISKTALGADIDRNELEHHSGEYDLLTLNHSLEHMRDQIQQLSHVKRLLRADGHALIRVPLATYAWSRYRTDWVQLDAPRHFYLHTVKSLQLAASKAGLTHVSTKFDSSEYQFIGSEVLAIANSVDDNETRSSIEALILANKMMYRRFAGILNNNELGDQACFIFRPTRSRIATII